ncbi:TPA: phage tail protein, partial [Escherichia coli]
MYFVDNNSGVTDMPPLAPSQGTQVKWFTEGDGRKGISHIGQDWLNIVQAELLAILTEGKVQPDKAKLNQLVTAIKAIIAANAYSRKNNLKEIADAGAEAQAAARRHLGLGGLSGKDSLAAADVGALEKSRNFDDVLDKPTARLNLDVYSKGEGDARYLRRDQNGADIPDKGTFINNLGLRETVNKAANALPSDGTAAAANRLATPVNINGVPFDGTRDINITSGMPESTANQRYVTGVRLGAQALS